MALNRCPGTYTPPEDPYDDEDEDEELNHHLRLYALPLDENLQTISGRFSYDLLKTNPTR